MTPKRVLRACTVAALLLLGMAAAAAVYICGPAAEEVSTGVIDADVSEARLRETVEVLSGRFRKRWITDLSTLEDTARWIAGQMEAAGLEAVLEPFEIHEGTVYNVIGRPPGTEDTGPTLVVGAHYDAYGEFPGADDNASGVAALLELARSLPPARADRPIRLVAFANEEPPFFGGDEMGSYRHARGLAERGIEVELMISLEMVGCFSDEPGSQQFPLAPLALVYPTRGNFIAVVGDPGVAPAIRQVKSSMRAATTLPVYSLRAPTWVAGVDWSDHASFRRLGFPAVMITDTAFLRNPRYHTRDDTPDTLDYRRMAEVVRGVHGVLRDRAR